MVPAKEYCEQFTGYAKRSLYPKLVRVQQCSRCARTALVGYSPSMPQVLSVCRWGTAELL